nr:glycosyltransferase [Lachnospiraceae bacterium]
YLLLDEWDNDRNFVGGELKLTASKYDVTVICNSAKEDLNPLVKYSIYKRPGKLSAVLSLIKMIFDKDSWKEFGRVLKEKDGRCKKLSEAVRFYINADMFRVFMKKNGFLEDNAIYYSYWYFWKCYAVTHEIDRYPGSRVITRTHEYDLYDYTSPSGYQPFKVSMDEKLDCIIFIAEHGRDYYLKKYGRTAGEKYKLYHLGTEQSCKVKAKEEPEEGKPRDEEQSGVMTMVSCSSIITRKRVDRIAEALGLINDLDVRWLHFGTGDCEDKLKKLCEDKLKGKKNISCELKGYVKNEELHKFYEQTRVDCFITASSSEGNPVSVMEAMSYGIPVIAPNVCNFPNMIKDCGILVSGECTPGELAEAIRKIKNMPSAETEQMRYNAYKCWDDNFNADKNNRRFVEEVLDRI